MSNANTKEELRFYFFHGKGSSGKDTQAASVTEGNPAAVVISTGELVRDAEKHPDHRHHEVLAPHLDIMRNGGLLPDEAIIQVAMREMEMERAKGATDFVFTGFPRTINQLTEMDEILEEMKQSEPIHDTHVYFAVSDNTARRRAEKRRTEAESNFFDVRRDDLPHVVENRLNVFRDSTQPMVNTLLHEGRLHVVRAIQGIDEVKEVLDLKLRRSEQAREMRKPIPLEPVEPAFSMRERR